MNVTQIQKDSANDDEIQYMIYETYGITIMRIQYATKGDVVALFFDTRVPSPDMIELAALSYLRPSDIPDVVETPE